MSLRTDLSVMGLKNPNVDDTSDSVPLDTIIDVDDQTDDNI